MNNWTEIKIAVSAANIDKASDIANVVVPYGIYIEDYSHLEEEVLEIANIDLIDTNGDQLAACLAASMTTAFPGGMAQGSTANTFMFATLNSTRFSTPATGPR